MSLTSIERVYERRDGTMQQLRGFEKQLFPMTTIIQTTFRHEESIYSAQASGFFYTEMERTNPGDNGPQWCKIGGYWLVTNRHVVIPIIEGKECVLDSLSFQIRRIKNAEIIWQETTLERKALHRQTLVHPDPRVDVAVIDIAEFIRPLIEEMTRGDSEGGSIMLPTSLSNLNLPENQQLSVDVTSDIIVASYPKGFYDDVNKFPIVKSGIVASAWGFNFRGLPMFQIDAQLFPGSSGGLVISKPTNIALINDALAYSKSKEFVLLGIYSGEYTQEETVSIAGENHTFKKSYGLGNVWYSSLIPEIIKHRVLIP